MNPGYGGGEFVFQGGSVGYQPSTTGTGPDDSSHGPEVAATANVSQDILVLQNFPYLRHAFRLFGATRLYLTFFPKMTFLHKTP